MFIRAGRPKAPIVHAADQQFEVGKQTRPYAMEFVGIQDTYAESGTPEELMRKYGLVADNVVVAAQRVTNRK